LPGSGLRILIAEPPIDAQSRIPQCYWKAAAQGDASAEADLGALYRYCIFLFM